MTTFVSDEEHYDVVLEKMFNAQHVLWIGTAFTDEPHLVDGAMEEFDRIWRGEECKKCGRKEFCIDRIK